MNREIYETNIEVLFREELEKRGLKRGIDFATQFPIRYSFILDFAFKEQMIAIEVDGEAFHPTHRDTIKDKVLGKLGWTVLRFWGREIEEDVSKCVDKTLENLKNKY